MAKLIIDRQTPVRNRTVRIAFGNGDCQFPIEVVFGLTGRDSLAGAQPEARRNAMNWVKGHQKQPDYKA
jgi:hypothetical protein